MHATVIIPARNAGRFLPATLGALGDAEVVVVDNGSTDDTAAVALAHGARVVHEPRPNRGRARNAGVRASDTPLIAFLDAECVPEAGWLGALTACLEQHPLAAGRTIVAAGPTRAARFDARWRFRTRETIERDGWATTANLGIRRELFERLGGFDERFRHAGEDVDLCRRAGPITYCPEAVVHHPATTSVRAVFERGFRHGHGSVQLGSRRDWRHPKPMLAGDWALRRFGLEDEPDLRWIARADYAGRVAGSLWAELRRAR
jgi:GT2 family glycosyltransferase